jgi:hypothetical protein
VRIASIAGVALVITVFPVAAAFDLTGRVTYSGSGVPGATVVATRGDGKMTTISGDDGSFRFLNLDDGVWTIRVEMLGFASAMRDATLPRAADAEPLTFALALRPYAEIMASSLPAAATGPAPAAEPTTSDSEQVDLITGSVINGATTAFAQPRAFGNNRPRPRSLYNFGVTVATGNSAWNARPFSLLGSAAPAPSYGDYQAGATLSGPLRIPWLVSSGPSMQVSYQHGDIHRATTASAVMPTTAERVGDFTQSPTPVRDPLTGQPFPGNVIPADRINPVAASLVGYYPLPHSAGPASANFQRPVVMTTRSDRFQFGLTKSLRNRTSLSGAIAWQRAATESVSLFGFADKSRQSSVTIGLNWSRQVSSRWAVRARYDFAWLAASVTPFFAGRTNVSGDAGLTGNDQDPANWGPPTLVFPDVAGLTDGEWQRTANTTHAIGGEVQARRGSHNITIGGDFRWHVANIRAQPNPRGTLTFTGAASGNAFGDFLLGIPSASSIAFGNTRTHLRGVSPDVYITDDWRVLPTVTLNVGLRWEYDSPFTESSGHLANLDIAPGFSAVAPVLAADPIGPLTGARYPPSLLRPDEHGFQPRVGASWRPSLSSSIVVKGSYGLYRNLGGYQSLALLLSQQAPFAKTFNIENTPATPLTLEKPFPASLSMASNTFAIDPDFRVSNAHTWQVSIQRELPASLTLLVAYLGTRGSHLMQALLPNTEAPGSAEMLVGPKGFIYVTSNGTSRRHAAQVTLRRRLYAGLMASVEYTLAKATDDAAAFGSRAITPAALSLAQDWRDLAAERGPSSFDQRHHVDVQVQYTTGVGLRGGTLLDGLWGSFWKDWTVATELSAGSGLPFTPVAFLPIAGTGVVGIRPSRTGVSITPIAPGTYANPEAFTAPVPGTWGNAGRNSLRGPSQLSMDLTVARAFRLGARLNLEWRLAATNVLNRVTFGAVEAIVGSPQFGRATVANPMRALRTTVRLRF